ncbi:hypothetical protein Q4520_18140 [Alteromonas sp. 1_MG-2023]|uniref:alpha/beta hydrolase n=1 Tax=Alteromonas sp. 1_MG-2023 TaxID=3062669 RepID=UPI0026E33F47|nr:hypothetical protein [Alteromonas sp. 1_MG-2023]MDO6477347.1 hypothetical protein [Alteromonas sp. 1_MG-2023]
MFTIHRTTLFFLAVFFITGCQNVKSYHEELEGGIEEPEIPYDVGKLLPFEEYVSSTKQHILTQLNTKQSPAMFQGGYSIQEAARMRSPFQYPINSADRCSESKHGGNLGFLLIHGLTDSPYLMSGLRDSIKSKYKCALIRAIVLPGHSTIPGHSRAMSYGQWLNATTYGVQSFKGIDNIDSVYVMTFSTGAPLIIRHLAETTEDNKVKGAVFISAAIKAKHWAAPFSGVAKHFIHWTDVTNEQDAARYESFSSHAGAEFYLLTKVLHEEKYQFRKPIFVAISADDSTVSAEAALKYFCNAETSKKTLIWYQHAHTEEPLSNFEEDIGDCRNHILLVEAEKMKNKPDNYISFSHTSLSIPPNDPHYGIQGRYKQCKAYFDIDEPEKEEFIECIKANGVGYLVGENSYTLENEADKKDVPWRRGTYNPAYAQMEAQIFKFLESIQQ